MEPRNILIQAGIDATPARIAVYSLIAKSDKPIDANSIIKHLNQENLDVNRVTVFRIINLFMEKKVIRKVELSEGKARYELASLPHHHHAVCTKCGTIQDIEDCMIRFVEAKIALDLAFKVQSHNLEFFGVCQKCQ